MPLYFTDALILNSRRFPAPIVLLGTDRYALNAIV